jgi:phosphoglycerate dehydrogenase-like enzyme
LGVIGEEIARQCKAFGMTVGGMSDIYQEQVMPIVAENLRRFLQGERRNLVNYIER